MKELTVTQIAESLNISLEEVCIMKAGAFSRHIVIKGRAYCGRIDSDGYNIPTQFDYISEYDCKTCLNRHSQKVGA